MFNYRRCANAAFLAAVSLFGWELNTTRADAEADETAFRQQVTKIVDVGWGESFRCVEPAEREYRLAKKLAPADPRVPYAFALVNIKHRKYTEATKLLDEVVRLDERHLPARQAKIWIEVLFKRYDKALPQIEQFGRLLTTDDEKAAGVSVHRQRQEAARFLGCIISFLEGPAQKAAITDHLASVKRQSLETLSEELREEFTAGHRSVAVRFSEFVSTTETTKVETKIKQEEHQQSEVQRLANERISIATKKQALEERAVETREKFEQYLSEINAKLSPLSEEYARLDAQAATIRQQINAIDVQIMQTAFACQMQSSAACQSQQPPTGGCATSGSMPSCTLRSTPSCNTPSVPSCNTRSVPTCNTPAMTCNLQPAINGLSSSRSNLVSEFRRLETIASRVYAQGMILVQSRNTLVQRYNVEAKRQGHEQVTLSRAETRFCRDEKRNSVTPNGNCGKTTSLVLKAAALTTYDTLTLDWNKRCVLESGTPASAKATQTQTVAQTETFVTQPTNASTNGVKDLDAYRALLMSVGRLPEESQYRLQDSSQVTSSDSTRILQMAGETSSVIAMVPDSFGGRATKVAIGE